MTTAPSERPSLTLSPYDVDSICLLSGRAEDLPIDEQTDITIGWLDEHEDGPGWYAWLTEHPDEGSVRVGA